MNELAVQFIHVQTEKKWLFDIFVRLTRVAQKAGAQTKIIYDEKIVYFY